MVGSLINFVAIDPIKALFWSAVLNGIVAVPVMVMTMRLAMHPKVMGRFVVPRPLAAMGWLSTAAMAATVAMLLVSAVS